MTISVRRSWRSTNVPPNTLAACCAMSEAVPSQPSAAVDPETEYPARLTASARSDPPAADAVSAVTTNSVRPPSRATTHPPHTLPTSCAMTAAVPSQPAAAVDPETAYPARLTASARSDPPPEDAVSAVKQAA